MNPGGYWWGCRPLVTPAGRGCRCSVQWRARPLPTLANDPPTPAEAGPSWRWIKDGHNITASLSRALSSELRGLSGSRRSHSRGRHEQRSLGAPLGARGQCGRIESDYGTCSINTFLKSRVTFTLCLFCFSITQVCLRNGSRDSLQRKSDGPT